MYAANASRILWLLGLAAFWAGPSAASARLNVLTTTQTLRDLTERVGGERVKVESFTKGSQDPHFVEAKPSFMVRARDADLLVIQGLDLEIGWIGNIVRGSRNPSIQEGQPGYLEAGLAVERVEVPAGGRVDRSEGDIHPFGNPHFHLDPLRAVKAARAIAERLAKLDPAGAGAYSAGAARFAADVDARMKGWTERMKGSGVMEVVTYHRTLSYFLDRFGVKRAAELEPKPGVPPSAKHLLSVINLVRERRIPCLLTESFFEPGAAERVRKEAPGAFAETVPTEVGAVKGVNDYFALIEAIVKGVESCGAKAKGARP
ncbi:MAG: zinc ABC transporter substrate-binding protein [Bdellovibrionales bacterium]|nr:zinc ABC transporter substrate-binding protein [Bdellovibrionales bacterium]